VRKGGAGGEGGYLHKTKRGGGAKGGKRQY
jgi:hypothetical protein